MLGLICPRLCISLLICLFNGFLIWVKSSQAMLWYNIFLLTAKQIPRKWTGFMNESLFYNIYNIDASFLIFPLGSIQPKMSGAGWPTLKKNRILWYSVWSCLCYRSLCVATQWLWCYLQSVDDFAGMSWLCIEFASREIGVLNEICSKVRVDTSILWCHHVIKTIK